MKHCLILDSTIRLGQYLTKVIGPFNTPEEARAWYDDAKATWQIAPPAATLTTIMGAHDDH